MDTPPDRSPPDPSWQGLNLAAAFERWKRSKAMSDTALASHLRITQPLLAELAGCPLPVTNADVHRLCLTYGIDFERLADLLWSAATSCRTAGVER